MNPPDSLPVLFVAAGSVAPSDVQWIEQRFPGRPVSFLALDSKQDRLALPSEWTWLRLEDLGSLEELLSEYLHCLESVPERVIRNGATLNSLFRRRDGYSIWWTDVGVRRSPTQGMFLKIKAIWMVTRAIAKTRPSDAVIHTPNPRDAAILFAAVKHVPNAHFSPGSVLPAPLAMVELKRWFKESMSYLKRFIKHRLCRYRAMQEQQPVVAPVPGPVVVMSTLYPRHVNTQAEVAKVGYWDSLSEQISAEKPAVAIRYLMDLEVPDAWPLQFDFQYLLKDAQKLASNPALVPRWRGHANRWTWLMAWRRQCKLLRRYYRLEGDPNFRSIFRYLDVDLSPEWIVELRHSISMSIWWESEVDAATAALRACGDVRVVLVNQEFELPGIILIAACRRLGIKSVGVQHGTFYPLHTTHTPPAAQIESTPVPDYFAVYGAYHKEVVSKFGRFPADRIWTCAGSRFDAHVKYPPDRKACRDRLGIPADQFVILITTQAYSWFRVAIRAILSTAPADCLVCIKKYSKEASSYDDLLAESGREHARIFIDGFEDLLGACDVLISGSSTTILETTLIGKPTVCLNFSSEPNNYPYVEEGVSLSVRRPEEMGAVLKFLRDYRPDEEWQKKRMRFLERHLGPAATGNAAAVFAVQVRQIVMAK